MLEQVLVSLIFPVKNEGNYVLTTLESALQVNTHYPFEIIVVDDGSTDGCCDFIETYSPIKSRRIQLVKTDGIGLAKAKNLGAEHSTGDYLIFCDAHLYFEDLWIDRLLELVRTGKADAVTPGIAPTTMLYVVGYGQKLDQNLGIQWNAWQAAPFPCAVLPGGCCGMSRKVFFDIQGFDHDFRGWGYEDVDISLKLWLFGYKCYVQPSVKVLHLFRETYPYAVTWENTYYNMLRMAYSHFNKERIQKCKQLIKNVDADYIESLVLKVTF